MTIFTQIAAVLLVLSLLWLVGKKKSQLRWDAFGKKQERSLQIVEQVRLTPHHSIHLVRLGDRIMIVAVDPCGCHLLGRGRQPHQTNDVLRARGQGA